MASYRKTRNKRTVAKGDKQTHFSCTICKKDKLRNQFFSSNKPIWEEHKLCLICKSCLSTMLIDEKTKQMTLENWKKVLSCLDIPHIPSIYTKMMSKEGITPKTIVGEYKRQLNLHREFSELTYLDSVQFEVEAEEIQNNPIRISQEVMEFWGLGYEPKEYMRFENRYKRLLESEKDGNIDYIKELYYKALPKLELQAEKQLMANDTKAHKDTMTTIKDICSVCNINPIQVREDNAGVGSYDIFIKRIENEDPVFDFERDLGNRDEVREFLELYLYSYLYEVNNLETPFTEQLNEELESYTPSILKADDEDDEDGE